MRDSLPSLLLAGGLVLVVILGACDGPGSGATTLADPGATSTTAPASGSDEFLDNFIAVSVAEAAGTPMSAEGARCLAEETFDVVGKDRLIEIGFSEDGREPVAILDGDVGFVPRERAAVAGAFATCLDDPFAFLLATTDEPDDEIEDCVLNEIQAAGITLEQLLFAEIAEYEEVVGQAGIDAVTACTIGESSR